MDSYSADNYSALIVDDEPAIRQATARALRGLGFQCDLAADGQQSLQLLSANNYRLVLTDLRMPEVNGHQLAIEVLRKPDRPVVIVITGVMEERLERDLRARGVDDILFKPVNYPVVAARAKELVESRAAARSATSLGDKEASVVALVPNVGHNASASSPDADAMECGDRLARATIELPVAPPEYDAVREASQNAISNGELDAAIGNDPRLAAAVVRLINAVAYGSNQRIDRLQQEMAGVRPRELQWLWPTLTFSIGACLGGLIAIWAR
jgi:DNA-binding response OmpR family regulator